MDTQLRPFVPRPVPTPRSQLATTIGNIQHPGSRTTSATCLSPPEHEDAWTELPDRHMQWAPNLHPHTGAWEAEWVCLRCNTAVTAEHPLLHDLPDRPRCDQDGPRCLAVDIKRGCCTPQRVRVHCPPHGHQHPHPPSTISPRGTAAGHQRNPLGLHTVGSTCHCSWQPRDA